MILIDDLFHRLTHRLKRSQNQRYNEHPRSRNDGTTIGPQSPSSRRGPGNFKHASHFVVDRPTFIEHQSNAVHLVGKAVFDPVLELIAPHTDPNAAVDSSARFPPPLCHPGTRLIIQERLSGWLGDSERKWNMIWLHGPAGTGKSAVAQSFAERCVENRRLGASFFFSRPNDRNDPNTVIPSLVYQLAVHYPNYKSLLMDQLANDPQLLWKARHIQFKKLIVEPFSQLQAQKRKRIREPLLIVLDGLDECRGEDAQRDIIEMISEATRLKKDLPILWLICSRPEAHLKYIFSKADFTVHCGREELAIDAESIQDVDFYLRDGLAGIKTHFPELTTPTWPLEEQTAELSEYASGHFGFASTSLRYIGDLTFAAPMFRLNALLSFLKGIKVGTSNPLEALDALYTRILCDVPDEVLPMTKRILGLYSFIDLKAPLDSARGLCNFLRIDQATFYNAFRRLHSVIDVPSPEVAVERNLRFYHASFEDYLLDADRSGKFSIVERDGRLDHAKSCLSWYKTDLELFHSADGPAFNDSHEHGVLPDLRWISEDDREEISCQIASYAQMGCWVACCGELKWDEALISQIQNFDFRYIQVETLDQNWRNFINKLRKNSSGDFVRTKPHSEADLRLLGYMESMIKSLWSIRPALLPLDLNDDDDGGEYFLLGHGSQAVVCWTTGGWIPMFGLLNQDEEPTKERIDAYYASFNDVVEENGSDEDADNDTFLETDNYLF